MRPFETLETFETPEGKLLTLHRHDHDLAIHLDGEELMSSRAPGSETTLAKVACRSLRAKRPRVLIGGLGLGFTLRAALDSLPEQSRVVVAEIFECVAEWNRRYVAEQIEALGRPLDDPRVEIQIEDVHNVIAAASRGAYHAILLDVDNGPGAWCLRANSRLYGASGLGRIRAALAAGGVLAVWSTYPDPRFVGQLRRAGFEASREKARTRGKKGNHHTIFVARKPAGRSS